MPVDEYGTYALNSIWIYNVKRITIKKDLKGLKQIQAYILNSNEILAKIRRKINSLVESKEELIIWGVGSLTSRLLATTRLKKAKIKYFVDNNRSLQGKKIVGIPILNPSALKKEKTAILICSFLYKDVISQELINKLGYKGKIITF